MALDQPSPDTLSEIPKKISLHSQLPNFKDVSKEQETVLFISKLRQCNKLIRVDDEELRKLKHLVLYELLDYVNAQNNNFPLESIPDFFNTVTINVFRESPKPEAEDEDVFDPEEDEPIVDEHWYHLQFIYEMLLRFVYSSQNQQPEYEKSVKKHIDGDFVIRLMQLFNESDPRERDYIKTILHRVYANFMGLRAYIRSALKSELEGFICGAEQHSGICDILEILGSIINGYATPLKQEHILFLTECLIPLHKIEHIKLILPELSYCVSKYIEKDQSISAYVMHEILGYFPRLNSAKEVSFLTEIEELLELISPKELLIEADDERTVQLNDAGNSLWLFAELFEVVAQSVCSIQFEVAEKAVNMVGNQKFMEHILFAYQTYNTQYGIASNKTSPLPEISQILGSSAGASTAVAESSTSSLQEEKPPLLSEQIYELRYNPIFTLAKALRINCTSHWNSNIRAASEQTLKQLLTLNDNDFPNLDVKIVQDLVLREVEREARDASWQIIAKKAHGSVNSLANFCAYFRQENELEVYLSDKELSAEQLRSGFVPGYSAEQITEEAIEAAEVPEDPLFCRCEELGICHVGMAPEDLTGAIDGFFLSYQGMGKSLLESPVKIGDNETPADSMLERGFDLNEQQIQSDCVDRICQFLLEKEICRCNKLSIVADSVETVEQRLPGKRLANRRASAGIPETLGIRRKSVTPMSMAAMQAKEELEGFEKHKITDK